MSEISPEIAAAVQERRAMTESERLSFSLDEMACNIRHWLRWTKEQRDKEGLPLDFYASVQFPSRPTYPQFTIWADRLEQAAEEMRRLRKGVSSNDQG